MGIPIEQSTMAVLSHNILQKDWLHKNRLRYMHFNVTALLEYFVYFI